jgi:hypothetical protein
MATITWLNKIDGSDAGDPQKNVNSADMNQIKTVVNTNDGNTSTVQTNLNTHAALTNNPHSVNKTQVGLSNVDNTSDANKPVSTAQAAADALKANIASPTFTGVPAGPTASPGTNTTQLATTAFVEAVKALLPLLTSFVWNEVPSGTINGVNDTFTLSATPLVGANGKSNLMIFSAILLSGEGEDYTQTGPNIVFNTPPEIGTNLRAFFMK